MMKISEFLGGTAAENKARKEIERLEKKRNLSLKDKTKLDEVRHTARRHTARIFGTAGVGAAALAALIAHYSANEPNSATRPVKPNIPHQTTRPQQPKLQIEELLKIQAAQKSRTSQALARFENLNDRARDLTRMMKENAFYTVPLNSRVTQQIIPGDGDGGVNIDRLKNPHAFEIVYMPEQYSKSMPAAAIYDWRENVLRVAATFKSDEWLAIVLLHELSHVWDKHYGGENPANPQEWINGEVRAHEMECGVIRNLYPDNYSQLIKEGIPLYREGRTTEIGSLGNRLFPLDRQETPNVAALHDGALFVCIAFENAKSEGRRLEDVYKNEIMPKIGKTF